MTGAPLSSAGAPVAAWRGPVLDYLQHRWPDEEPPPWAERTLEVYERRVAVTSGYLASTVPWDTVRGLTGPHRLTRLDVCVDVVLPGHQLGARQEHECINTSDTGETKYWGSPGSEVQWKIYRYRDYTLQRPFLWLQQAADAQVALEHTWRIELRARGRRARALAEASTLAEAWAWAQSFLPAGWPATVAAESPPVQIDAAVELAAEQLAARLHKYVESQARRHGARVGLTAASARVLLADLARRALRHLAGEPERWTGDKGVESKSEP